MKIFTLALRKNNTSDPNIYRAKNISFLIRVYNNDSLIRYVSVTRHVRNTYTEPEQNAPVLHDFFKSKSLNTN